MERNRVKITGNLIAAIHSTCAAQQAMVLQGLENVHQKGLGQAVGFRDFARGGDGGGILRHVRQSDQAILGFFADAEHIRLSLNKYRTEVVPFQAFDRILRQIAVSDGKTIFCACSRVNYESILY